MISTKIYNHIVMRIRDEKRAEHVEIAESRHVFPGIQDLTARFLKGAIAVKIFICPTQKDIKTALQSIGELEQQPI